jgi:hypothetical protein
VLVPARLIDWDAIDKHMEADSIQTLTMYLSFIYSENERDQCLHVCRLLRMERMPAIPYFMIAVFWELTRVWSDGNSNGLSLILMARCQTGGR